MSGLLTPMKTPRLARIALAPAAVAALTAACAGAPPPQPCAQPESQGATSPPPSASAAPPANQPDPAGSASASTRPSPGRPATQTPRSAVSLGLCTADEEKAARDEIDAIGRLVRALPPDTSPAAAAGERIANLHGSPCYRPGTLLKGVDTREIKAASAWSLKQWWQGGGRDMFDDCLDHANAVHIAPTLPPMLAAETLPAGDPMLAVVCPTWGTTCDPIAQGAALDIGREADRVGLRESGRHSPESGGETCAQTALKEGMDTRLATFAACVSRHLPRRTPVPEARYRSPKGWLVLRGRRGHYGFCDEVRAYDLDTGAAYVASRCGGLVLRGGGSVDQDATRGSGAVQTQVGTLSVDALRKVALALWLKERLNDDVHRYAKFDLPVGVPLPAPGRLFGTGYGYGWAHSGQTTIRFEISDGGRALLAGDFVWPDSGHIGDQVVDDLVVSAETTLREGCPPAALPASLAPAGSLGGVSAIDASADALKKTAAELADAFTKLRKTKVCKAAPKK